jgi:hypothetical protein
MERVTGAKTPAKTGVDASLKKKKVFLSLLPDKHK